MLHLYLEQPTDMDKRKVLRNRNHFKNYLLKRRTRF